MTEVKAGNTVIDVGNWDKVFFPDEGYTKGDLVEYYHKVADTMLPHIKNRAISMHRFPDGIEGESFFQKNAPKGTPDWVQTAEIGKKEGGKTNHVVCNDTRTLIYLANYGCITPHIWLSKIDSINNPDRLVFDLDPPGDDFSPVRRTAKRLKQFCEDELNLTPFLMTTGSKGLHVVLPLDGKDDFDHVREFAQDVAEYMAGTYSEEITTAVRKKKRGGKLFMDTARNAYAQTGVAPYSVRALPGAPVATPLEWDELSDSDLNARKYNIKNLFRRLGRKDDPWRDINRHKFSCRKASDKLEKLMKKASS